MKKYKITKINAFTLVELIIVISILAILTTIAFVSFQWYMKWSRDSNRVTTITEISKWIETFFTKTWNIPMVDNQIGTGTITGNPATYVWYIWDNVSKLIKVNKSPIDPLTNTNYIYGIDISKTKYQVASIVEDLQMNKWYLITNTYADWWVKARVLWNYQWLLKFNWKVYNIPSLIITFSGGTSHDLLANNTNYIIDKIENLPYIWWNAKQLNTFTPTQVLQKLAYTWAILTITWLTIPTDLDSWNTNSWILQATFWYNIDVIWQSLFWDKYFIDIKGNTWGWSWWWNFTCGISTVSAWWFTYNTLALAWKCRTVGSMKHGTLLVNWNTLPTDINAVEKWCPMPNGTAWTVANIAWNCDSYSWALYTWYEAMGLNSTQNSITTEDTSKSVCWQLGTGWHLPDNIDWTTLTTAWANWWTGNRLFWLISSLPGYRLNDGSLNNLGINGDWWSSTWYSTINSYNRYLTSWMTSVSSNNSNKLFGFSILCVKD